MTIKSERSGNRSRSFPGTNRGGRLPSAAAYGQSAEDKPRLESDEVHIWLIDLVASAQRVGEMMETLSTDELDKAARFRYRRHKDRYVLGRSSLRLLLARYLGVEAADVRFAYGENGKPSLHEASPQPDLGFNLAHSNELAVLAIARGVAVGVDVEHIRRGPIERDLAERFFSPREIAALNALPETDRGRGFFNCWVRKEAYLKARGDGLAFPLDAFSVSLTPSRPPRLLENRLDPAEPGRWNLYSLSLSEGYVGALAVPTKAWRLRYFRLEE